MQALERTCAAWRAALDARALRDAGVTIEDKRYSLSLHDRAAPDHDLARRAIAAQVATLAPRPQLIDGKCVVNVLPPDAPTKGSALRELLAQLPAGCALYAGDDDTDEHVFDLPRDLVLGVRIGASPGTRATLHLDDPAQMLPLVELMIERAAG